MYNWSPEKQRISARRSHWNGIWPGLCCKITLLSLSHQVVLKLDSKFQRYHWVFKMDPTYIMYTLSTNTNQLDGNSKKIALNLGCSSNMFLLFMRKDYPWDDARLGYVPCSLSWKLLIAQPSIINKSTGIISVIITAKESYL